MMLKFKSNALFFVSLILFMGFLPGCQKSQPDHYVQVKNAKGILPDAKVIGKGMEIGSVTDVQPFQGRIRVDFELFSKYHESLRQGVKAAVIKDYNDPSQPTLRLLGGDDATCPVLEKYQEIPEASFFDVMSGDTIWEWLWTSHAKWMLTICVIILTLMIAFVRLIKSSIRFVFFVLLMGVIAWSGYVVHKEWKTYKSAPAANSTEMLEALKSTLSTEEAYKILEAAKNEFANTIKESSGENVKEFLAMVNRQFTQQIDKLKAEGKDAVVEELKSDQSMINSLLSEE